MDFMPEDGDIIIASYPKTGTTWMQYIVLQIISGGESYPSFDDATYKIAPFIELVGIDAVKVQRKPRMYKHHIAYDMVQKNSESKCIYTYRHPEDTVVSYYHFLKNMVPEFALDFNTYFDRFVAGNIAYGNYFRHVLSFYEHREDGNLLMVSYEKQHANRKQEILRAAKFLGADYYRNLSVDGQLLDRIVERTSFDYMKKNLTLTHPDIATKNREKSCEEHKNKVEFFRKGIVGDGKAVLTDSQRQRLKLAAEKVLKGTSIIAEWYP